MAFMGPGDAKGDPRCSQYCPSCTSPVTTRTDVTGAGREIGKLQGGVALWVREQWNVSIQISAQCVSVLGELVSQLHGKGRARGISLAQESRKAGLNLRGAGHCQHIPEIPAG